jgi:hypothetical protein
VSRQLIDAEGIKNKSHTPGVFISSSSKNYSASCSIYNQSCQLHVPAIQSVKYVNDMARVSIVGLNIILCPAVMKGGKISLERTKL